jgi:hypothetical protein
MQQRKDLSTALLPEFIDDPSAHRRSDPGSGGEEDEFGDFV